MVLCLCILVSRYFAATAIKNHSLFPSKVNRVEDDHHRQHRRTLSFSADEGCGTGCSTSSTLFGGMANVEPIVPWVGGGGGCEGTENECS